MYTERLETALANLAELRARRDASRAAINLCLEELRRTRKENPNAFRTIAEAEARLAYQRAETLEAHKAFNDASVRVRTMKRAMAPA